MTVKDSLLSRAVAPGGPPDVAIGMIKAQHGHMVLGLIVIVVVAVLIAVGFWVPAVREWVATRGGGGSSSRRAQRRS